MRKTVFYLIFDLTGLILTIYTLQSLIRTIPKPMWILGINNFPMNQYHERYKKQAPAEEIFNKQHRCEHHKMSPVIDSAIHTASVLHNACLKRAKNNFTYLSTYICHLNYPLIQYGIQLPQIKGRKQPWCGFSGNSCIFHAQSLGNQTHPILMVLTGGYGNFSR